MSDILVSVIDSISSPFLKIFWKSPRLKIDSISNVLPGKWIKSSKLNPPGAEFLLFLESI
jgi:hypothetical protein